MHERTRAERAIMNSSVAKHYGCKHAKHCGLTAIGRSQSPFRCFTKLPRLTGPEIEKKHFTNAGLA